MNLNMIKWNESIFYCNDKLLECLSKHLKERKVWRVQLEKNDAKKTVFNRYMILIITDLGTSCIRIEFDDISKLGQLDLEIIQVIYTYFVGIE